MEQPIIETPPPQPKPEKPVEAIKGKVQEWTEKGRAWLARLRGKVDDKPKEVIEEVAEAPKEEAVLLVIDTKPSKRTEEDSSPDKNIETAKLAIDENVSGETETMRRKREIVAKCYQTIVEQDITLESEGLRPDIFCTDHFIRLPADSVAEHQQLTQVDYDHGAALSFAVEEGSSTEPVINRITMGRNRVLKIATPIKIDNQIFWELIAKGSGPSGHARRQSYSVYRHEKPDYALGLLGSWNASQEIQHSEALSLIGVRTGKVVESFGVRSSPVLDSYTLDATKLADALTGVDIVKPKSGIGIKIDIPYDLDREIKQLSINTEGEPTIIVRATGGDRMANIAGQDNAKVRLITQANAAMLGYEIEAMGIDTFCQAYEIPTEVRSDVLFLSQIDTGCDPNNRQLATSLLRVSSILHTRNANLIETYNRTHPNEQIFPSFKTGDIDFQGRIYDFESSEDLAARSDFGYQKKLLQNALRDTAQHLDRAYGTTGEIAQDIESFTGKYFIEN